MTDRARLDAILAERRAKKAAEEAAKKTAVATPVNDFADDLIPEEQFERSEEDREMDRIIAGIDIIDAYVKWCGKMRPEVKRGQRESIMISCPNPDHPDRKPSAWINLDKQTWFCGGCQIGGDAHDIAAYHFGVTNYKDGAEFHKLRRRMAEDFGYTFIREIGGGTTVVPPEPEYVETDTTDKPDKSDTSDTPPPALSVVPSGTAEVIAFPTEDDDDDDADDIEFPTLDWRAIVPPQTFLYEYLTCTTIDDVAEEYHFWNGMIALGLALGRDLTLFDRRPVYGNLFVCITGSSGAGKSRASEHLNKLINAALPHDWEDEYSKGARIIDTPVSPEVMVHSFQKPVYDYSDPKKPTFLEWSPVRALINFNELASLVGTAGREGNGGFVPTLQRFYDAESRISTVSLTTKEKIAENAFASVLTTTQPRSLRVLLRKSDKDSGFVNRWIFASGPEKSPVAIGGAVIDIGPAVAPLKEVQAYATTHDTVLQWSPEAFTAFSNFFHARLHPDKQRGGSMLGRIDLLMKKIILLFAANRKEETVSEDSVNRAIACYDYLIKSYGIPEGEIGNSLYSEIEEAVVGTVERHCTKKKKDGLTFSEIKRLLARRKYQGDLLKKVVDNLVATGELDTVKVNAGTVGRPTQRFKVVGS